MKVFNVLLALAALSVSAVSCLKEKEMRHEPGSGIRFSASTVWDNVPGTRTEYSGKDQDGMAINGSTSEYERIDWVERSSDRSGEDRIRIFCPQATGGDVTIPGASGTGSAADYFVSAAPTATGRVSASSIAPLTDASLTWGETGDHYFYAMYPAPGTTSNYAFSAATVVSNDAVLAVDTDGRVTVSGSIPSTQEAVWDAASRTFKANMNRAYMYAREKVAADATGSVKLSFQPLFTSVELTLRRSVPTDARLTQVELLSAGSPMTGSFRATLDGDGAPVIAAVGTPGNSVSVVLPTVGGQSGIVLSEEPVRFTFLTLPFDQTELTLRLTFSEGGETKTRTLKLQDSRLADPSTNPEGWITVSACKKIYIQGVDVPTNWEYHLGSLQNVELTYSGGTAQLSLTSAFQSYRSRGSVSEPAPYELQFSTNGTDWSATPPAWLSVTDPASGYDGSVEGETLSIVMDPQVGVPAPDLHAEALQSAPAKGTAAAPFDLSKVNPSVSAGAAGGWNNPSATRTTANTYVVHAPGYYSIPVVYGNLLKNGVAQTPVADNVVDHRDAHITSPYIGVQRSYNPAATDARLFWSDVEGTVAGTPGLVTNVTFHAGSDRTQDYITFEVPAATICQGNALIGLRVDDDNDGSPETVAWSWTVWVTDEDLSAVQTVGGYSFAPVNLGWCNTKWLDFAARSYYVRAYQPDSGVASDSVIIAENEGRKTNPRGNSLEYQWGRKDPMRATVETGANTYGSKTYYHSEYYPGGSEIHTTRGVSTRYPCSVFPTAGEIDTWEYNMDDKNLWESLVNPGAKQLFDPCPVGFHLPPFEAFSVFTASNFIWSTEDGVGGRKYGENLFFPAQSGSGSGNSARYWTYWSEDPYDFGEWSRALIISPTTLRVDALISHVQVVGIRPVLETNP